MKTSFLVVVVVLLIGFLSMTESVQGFAFPGSQNPAETLCNSNSLFPSADISVYFGWLNSSNGTVWTLERTAVNSTAAWPLKGWWLGAAKEVNLNHSFGFLASGGIFFPRNSSGTWGDDSGFQTVKFDTSSYEWYSIDSLLKAHVAGPFDILAGCRWDRTSTRVDYADNTSDDYILNAYMPIIGALYRNTTPTGAFHVKMLYAPVVWGQMKYNFWDNRGFAEFGDFGINNNSFFAEAFAEYLVKFRPNMNVGAFAKWDALQAKTNKQGLSGMTNESVAWSVNVRAWTFGGTLSMTFTTPYWSL